MGLLWNMLIVLVAGKAVTVLCKILASARYEIGGFFSKLERLGIWMHELTHIIMQYLLLIPLITKTNPHLDIDDYSARVSVPVDERSSFIKFVLMAFAPLMIGTVVITGIQDYSTSHVVPTPLKIVFVFLYIATFLTCSPSKPDIKLVFSVFRLRKLTAIKQIFLLGFATIIYIQGIPFWGAWGEKVPYIFELSMVFGIFSVIDLTIYGITLSIKYIRKKEHESTKFGADSVKVAKGDRKQVQNALTSAPKGDAGFGDLGFAVVAGDLEEGQDPEIIIPDKHLEALAAQLTANILKGGEGDGD